jgi:DNA-binding beta-propeller fold protein YncE
MRTSTPDTAQPARGHFGQRSAAVAPTRALAGSLMAALVFFLAPSKARADGPGLGNLTYSPGEQFSTIATFTDANSAPRGHGVVMMHRGYLAVVFSNDGGGGNGSGGFSFYDVSNPRSPVPTFSTLNSSTYTNSSSPHYAGDIREAHAFSFWGDIVCMPSNRGQGTGIQFWDWSNIDPPNPAPLRISRLSLPGLTGGDYAPTAWWVFWQGGRYAYVAGTSQGIYIVDASDPENPFLVDRGDGKPNPIPTSQIGNFRINTIFVIGNIMVVSASDASGLATLDISDPKNPVVLDTISPGSGLYSIMVNGDKILGAHDPARIWDISNPSNITLIGSGPDVADKGGYGMFQDGIFHYGSSSAYVKLDISSQPFTVLGLNSPAGFSNPDWDFATALGNLVFQGNDHSGSALIVHQTEPDTTPPAVNMVVPKNNATNQALTSRVGITFTDLPDVRTINSNTCIIRPVGGSALPGRYSSQSGIVNFWPDQPLQANTTYEVLVPVGGIKDTVGNATATQFVSLFSTGSQIGVVLGVSAQSPGLAATGTAVNFTATGTGEGTLTYKWDFGDGTEETPYLPSPNASHSYSAPGHYSVRVTITDGSTTANAVFTQTIHHPLPANAPTHSSTILFDATTNRVWTVNPDTDTVTAIDASTLGKLFERTVGKHPRTLARAPNGEIWVVNQEDATISVLNGSSGSPVTTLDLPHGSRPFGIAFSPNGAAAYVTLQGTGRLLRFSPSTRLQTDSVDVGPTPRGIAISGDSNRIFVTRFRSPDTGGEVTEVAAATLTISRQFLLAPDTEGPDVEDFGRGIPNYLTNIAISPDGSRAWIPSKKDNIFRGQLRDSQPLNFESTVRAIVSQIDLNANQEAFLARIDFNDREVCSAVGFTPAGDYAFVATQGNNTIEVVDAYSGSMAVSIQPTGLAPQGVALSPDGSRLFVQNFMGRSISVYDIAGITASTTNAANLLGHVSTVATEKLSAAVLQGKRIFYNADDNRMNRDKYLTCASCHLDGEHDGRTWDFTDRGEGLRNTTTLLGRAGMGHGRVHWSANFDEIQDFEHDIRHGFGGSGFLTDAEFNSGTRNQPLGDPKAGISPDLDALAAYVASLTEVNSSPHRNPDGSLTSDAVAGRKLFGKLGCYTCHADAKFTDSPTRLLHNVGTIKESSGQRLGGPLTGLDTPSLKGVWETAPYLHDGSAETLLDVITTANPDGRHGAVPTLSPIEKQQLVAFLRQIDDSETTYDFSPLVQMTEPVNGAVYVPGSTIPLAAHALDHLGAISKFEFFRNGAKLGEDTTEPFTFSYPDAAEGSHTFHARAHFLSGEQSETDPVTVIASNASDAGTIRVNFQPTGRPIPEDYLPDYGGVFANRGNGYSYGWNAVTDETRDRNSGLSPDQRYDTLNHLQKPSNPDAVWEIVVPNGSYEVFVVSGDAGATDGVFRMNVEGVLTVDGTPTSSNRWIEGTSTVTVSDGRLTVRSASGAVNNKICFIDITPLAPSVTVNVSAPVPNTSEATGTPPGIVRLARTGSTATALNVKVGISGTAKNGIDYATLAASYTIPSGSPTLDIPVNPISDNRAEGNQTVTLSLLRDPAYAPGGSSTATVTISEKPFDAWRFDRFFALDRLPEISGFGSDPFATGVAVGLAYALGVDPADADVTMLPQSTVSDGGFALVFKRPAGGAAGLAYYIDSSPGLDGAWSLLDAQHITITPNGDGTETVVARDPLPMDERNEFYLRLRVIEQ